MMEPNQTKLKVAELGPLDCLPPRNFETARLKLRAIEPGDSKLIFDLYASDPVATRYMSFKCVTNVSETAAFIEPAAQFFLGNESSVKQLIWVIYEKQSGAPIGSTGFGIENDTTLSGGYILNSNWWTHGYAPEAWSCILNWAKAQPRVMRIEAAHDIDNPNSGKVLKRCGMILDRIAPNHSVSPNISPEPRDAVIYAWVRP